MCLMTDSDSSHCTSYDVDLEDQGAEEIASWVDENCLSKEPQNRPV